MSDKPTDRSTDQQTDRTTDDATRPVTIGRTYVRRTAMRRNNSTSNRRSNNFEERPHHEGFLGRKVYLILERISMDMDKRIALLHMYALSDLFALLPFTCRGLVCLPTSRCPVYGSVVSVYVLATLHL